jgi:hypothetical protein
LSTFSKTIPSPDIFTSSLGLSMDSGALQETQSAKSMKYNLRPWARGVTLFMGGVIGGLL